MSGLNYIYLSIFIDKENKFTPDKINRQRTALQNYLLIKNYSSKIYLENLSLNEAFRLSKR